MNANKIQKTESLKRRFPKRLEKEIRFSLYLKEFLKDLKIDIKL